VKKKGTEIHNQVAQTQNMTSYRRKYVINKDNDPPSGAEIAAEEQSPFRPH
jgi:hypothetical protein